MIKIFLSAPDIGDNEYDYVESAMRTNWIAPLGPEVDKFESELAAKCDSQYAAVVSSGTAAIHLALQLIGVKRNDRVIVQSFTFVASANPILYLGAHPIFVDSEPHTWNICPVHLRAALEKCAQDGKPAKAVIVVDLYGVPAKYSEIEPICAEYDVPLIEDAAEALGSYYMDKPAGSFGAIGILSFNGNKIITTSGGGALLLRNEEYAKRARFLASQSRDPSQHYQHSEIGYNYRMSNILAALGRAQLADLSAKVKKRRDHFIRYKDKLSQLGIVFPNEIEGVYANRWLTTILLPHGYGSLDSVYSLQKHLLQSGIESRPLWKPLHLQPLYNDCLYFGDNCAQSLFEQGLCLPSGSGLSTDQIDFTIECIKTYFNEL